MAAKLSLFCVLLFTSYNNVIGSHVRQGKEFYNHDGHLRYDAKQPYIENTCGMPLWVLSHEGENVPDHALIAGKDGGICDGTVCGKDIYISMFNIDGGVAIGKTWFKRTDGSCASAALHGQSVSSSNCRILTMGSSTHDNVKFHWEKVNGKGNSKNRYTAPSRSLIAGNDNEYGPIYPCRFINDHGDYLVGQTWFPRHDEYCCSAEFGGAVVYGEHCEILTKEPC